MNIPRISPMYGGTFQTMLGYFKPLTSKLSQEDKEAYQNMYCTLCHTIKKQYGYTSTMFIQHDLLFLLLCTNSWKRKFGRADAIKAGCVMFPLKKVHVLEDMHESKALADLSVFTVYTAFLNSVTDGKSNRIKQKSFKRFFHKTLEESANKLQISQDEIQHLQQMLLEEHDNECTPDQIIAPVCTFYSELIVQHLGVDDSYKALAYHSCAIMYYLDALEDYKKDMKNGYFNILSSIYQNPEQIVNYVSMKIFKSLEIIKNYSINSHHQSLLDNILNDSILTQFHAIKQKHLG
ncbi:DUF5685 family protein [Bacillus massilinigeriensis]|uniref:DUF5685 family protein n=1 Tax=Bacillus massilionigeriensis TaxID=1805475 RepID=UPI0013564AD2|nr:DUF5685 family protein [Bacillus massilionigeriensis]